MCSFKFRFERREGGSYGPATLTLGLPMRGIGGGNSNNVGSISSSSCNKMSVVIFLLTYLLIYLLTYIHT
jgi:hypothetical protein